MSTIPTNPPANPVPGAVYIDIATNTAYVWTGTGWVPSGGSTGYNSQITTGAAILPGYFAEPTPESYVPQVGSEPTTPSEGMIWVDSTMTPSPAYVWNNGAWFKITDGTFTDTSVAAVPPSSPDQGDTYFETTTQRFYVWDGTAWQLIGEGDDTHSIFSMSTPSVRPNGDSLQSGDMWINSVNGNLSYWSGSTWVLMSAGGSATSSFATYATAPAVGAEGDTYYNTTDDTLYISDGVSWVAVDTNTSVGATQPASTSVLWVDTSAGAGNEVLRYYDAGTTSWLPAVTGSTDTHSFTGTGFPSLTLRPDGTALQDGDMYVDDATNTPYYYDLSVTTWKALEAGSDTHSFIGTGAPALSLRPDATPLQDGDMYVDDSTNKVYYWDAGPNNWTAIEAGNDTHAFTGTGAPSLTLRPDGTALQDGDMYVDDSTDGIYYYDLSAITWKATGGAGAGNDTHAFTGTGAPTLTVRPDATPLQDGDIYIDDSNNVGYYYDLSATAWKALSAGSGPIATPILEGAVFGATYNDTVNNVSLGYEAGSNYAGGGIGSSIDSTAIGWNASKSLAGIQNTIIGSGAAPNGTGDDNVLIGAYNTAYSVLNGAQFNTSIGAFSTTSLSSGGSNTVLGYSSGIQLTTGSANTFIGIRAGNKVSTGSRNTIIGTFQGTGEAAMNDNVILGRTKEWHTAGTKDSVVFRVNENNAYGVPTTASADNSTVDYGTSGYVLKSQGSTNPPVWSAPSGRTVFSSTIPGAIISVDVNPNIDQVTLLDASQTAVPVDPPSGLTNGEYHKFIAQQAGTPIVFSNSSGTEPWMNSGTTYSWTPAFVGQTATVTYYQATSTSGFGWLVELSGS